MAQFPKYTDVWVINHLCLPAVITQTVEVSYFALNVWIYLFSFISGSNAPQVIMFTFSVGFVNGLQTDLFTVSLTCQGTCISPFKLVLQPWWKQKAVFAGVSSLEFNTFSLCHFLSASHDIRNYSALVWIEPSRLGVLLPCSWVSDSNRGKLAVTKAGLGSCCYASETILFHRLFAHCQVNARQQVITAARNANKAQYSQGQVAFFIWGGIHTIEMYTANHSNETVAV